MSAADRATAASAIASQPTSRLRVALAELDALGPLDDAQTMARSWIAGEIARRSAGARLRLVPNS